MSSNCSKKTFEMIPILIFVFLPIIDANVRFHVFSMCLINCSQSVPHTIAIDQLTKCYFLVWKKTIRLVYYSIWKIGFSGYSYGYIDVGDGCWRWNVLVTTLRCWWRFSPFLSPTFFIFNIRVGPWQPKDVTNIEIISLTSIHLSTTSM